MSKSEKSLWKCLYIYIVCVCLCLTWWKKALLLEQLHDQCSPLVQCSSQGGVRHLVKLQFCQNVFTVCGWKSDKQAFKKLVNNDANFKPLFWRDALMLRILAWIFFHLSLFKQCSNIIQSVFSSIRDWTLSCSTTLSLSSLSIPIQYCVCAVLNRAGMETRWLTL